MSEHPLHSTLRRAAIAALLIAGAGCAHKPSSVKGPLTSPHIDGLMPPSFLGELSEQEDADELSAWVGHWVGEKSRLILARRADPVGATLFGCAPRGPFEGAYAFEPAPGQVAQEALTGSWWSCDQTLSKRRVTLRLNGEIAVLRDEAGRAQSLRRVGPVDADRLRRVRIIGHRGGDLKKESLCNSIRAVETAWSRGCSGVEIDVLVPYETDQGERIPLLDQMVAYHVDRALEGATKEDGCPLDELRALDRPPPALEKALRACADSRIKFVYVDPKLKWIFQRTPQRAKAAVESIADLTARVAEEGPGDLRFAIGAELTDPDQTGDLLRQTLDDAAYQSARLTWLPEFSRGTDPDRFLGAFSPGRDGAPPAIASFNLFALREGDGGILAQFVTDLNELDERRFAQSEAPIIVWTANSDDQFRRALIALERLAPAQTGAERPVAVLTDFPHRLAYYLAVPDSFGGAER